jgi:hypothetical protein
MAKVELEREKLQVEREKMQLDAETKVICAVIAAQSKPVATDMDPTKTAEDEIPLGGEELEPKVDMNAALVTALEGFQSALAEMRRPKKIIRDGQGNIAGVE